MAAMRDRFVDDATARDKYSSLHRHLLSVRPEPEWRTAFGELEAILGYRLPDSARLRRPLWFSSRMDTGYGDSLAQQAAGWHSREAGIEAETTVSVFREMSPGPTAAPARQRRFSIREILPPHDPGPWPEGFTVSREQIYDDMGRLTGGPGDMPGGDH